MTDSATSDHIDALAVIGMAGRFPGASNVHEFWDNLCNGVESISFFSDQELLHAGIDPAVLHEAHYVKAGAILDGIEMFDASFFGITPRDAAIMDPQHRLFLECAWEALEDAGYSSETCTQQIGIYAGAGINTYLLSNLSGAHQLIESVGLFQAMLGNEKDHLTTRTSYKLNLKGPSVNINTACSTSLVAVHMACQSLINGECDIALAGGVSIKIPQQAGYFYQEEGILSPDGHCRAFDARAQGTVGGSGVGIVVLKRLIDALNDRDSVHAVIRGSSINNDGSAKIGYTAPSIDGQAQVIAEAQAVARIEPEQITYIETHGTGTALGDPIEIAALTQVFRSGTQKNSFCAIGSVKTNIGHLDAASGVAGFIKAVLALEHHLLPPLLQFTHPNPHIDFANSPFYVNTTLTEWKTDGFPRLAGVSSFGIGGANAHVILEEAPIVSVSERVYMHHLLILSAKTETALQHMTIALAEHLRQHPDLEIADVAYTLQVGRRQFEHRRMLTCHDLHSAIAALETLKTESVFTAHQESTHQSVIFMFPGQGSQHVHMALELYQTEPVFREQVNLCAELLEPHLGLDLRRVLYPDNQQAEDINQQLTSTALAQPVLFVIEYALAKLLMSWGVHPQSMIGHSVGEYVAACLAGVFSLEDGLTLIAARGRMMQTLPEGAMLAVPLAEREIRPFLDGQLSLAAVNGPVHCVVSGPTNAIHEVKKLLAQQGVTSQILHTSHAFHSSMIHPIAEPFYELMKKIHLQIPKIPFVSNRTGTWITAEDATNPGYWVRHMLQTVRFAEGISLLLNESNHILLEVGPGQTLGKLAKQQADKAGRQKIFSTLPHPHDGCSDRASLLKAVGHLWLEGIQINWPALSAHQSCRRLSLPTYPFERKRYWLDAFTTEGNQTTSRNERQEDQQITASFSKYEDPGSYGVKNKEISMLEQQVFSAPHSARQARIESMLTAILGPLIGIDPTEMENTATFLDMGADSLLLLQASQVIRDRFSVDLRFRQMLEEYATVKDLAAHIVKISSVGEGSEDRQEISASPIPETLPVVLQPPSLLNQTPHLRSNGQQPAPLPALQDSTLNGDGRKRMKSSGLEQVIERQLQVMSQQLETLRGALFSLVSTSEEEKR